jgi:pimeloyl-ACP methyl ester carboxylesterase
MSTQDKQIAEADLKLGDGRTLHYYSAKAGSGDDTVVFWLHGTPNVGRPPEPLFAAAAEHGLRWVSYDRPGYGGSSPQPERTIGDAAADVAAIADELGVGRFTVFGHSGGAPHALACGALLPNRVGGVVCMSSPAPPDAAGLDWFAGWSPSAVKENRAALAGRAALEAYLPTSEFDPDTLIPADKEALGGRWSWLAGIVEQAISEGGDGMVEDALAGAQPWGFSLAQVTVPTLVLHGGQDGMVPSGHSEWIAAQLPAAQLRLIPGAGHITVLDAGPEALAWLAERVAEAG